MKLVAWFRLQEIQWSLPPDMVADLERRQPGIDVVTPADEAELATALNDAEVFFGWTFPREHFAGAPRLRWMHSANAGIEANLFPEMVASPAILTNAAGLHDVCIPEHVLALMLALARNLHESMRLQSQRRFERFTAIAFAGGVRELHGSKLAILGAGAIGKALARLAAALGMHVRAMRRRADRAVEPAEVVVGPERPHDLLGWADFVVLATPSTPQTRQFIDRAALAAMRPSAFLVNVGRGDAIDEAALVDALRTRAIAGAGLDTFLVEPLPAEHPFWGLDNLILTPHISGYTPAYFQRTIDLFADNLARFVRGESLRNVVDKQLGYVVDEAG